MKTALKARKAETAKIEKESLDATGLRSDVVPLYNGGEYWLYRYKKYTDIRLVFAPEQQIAFFGGDPDNFTFPRHDLDMALFRVYENGKPIDSQHYLKWNAKGAARRRTGVRLRPPGLDRPPARRWRNSSCSATTCCPGLSRPLKRRLDVPPALRRTRGRSRRARPRGPIFGLENALKAFTGEYEGLLDKPLMAKKQTEESRISRGSWPASRSGKAAYGGAWDAIAAAEQQYLEMLKPYALPPLRGSRLADMALQIVQLCDRGEEAGRRAAGRLPRFRSSSRCASVCSLPRQSIPELEEALLADSLQESARRAGARRSVRQSGAGRAGAGGGGQGSRSPARSWPTPPFRKSLVEGGEAAVAASTDPLIVLARKLDPVRREMQQVVRRQLRERRKSPAGRRSARRASRRMARSLYPDATFTLRLTYGAVKGLSHERHPGAP